MKWSIVLSTATLVASALASPIKRDADKRYVLRAYNLELDDLNGKYLSTKDNKVGIYNGGTRAGATQVYTGSSAGACPNSVNLHTWPIGIVDHALGLVGSDGYLDFVDLTAPAGRRENSTATYSWDEFQLTEGGDPGSQIVWKPGKTVKPGWVAFPGAEVGDWVIRYYDNDGGAIVSADYIPVKIVYEPAKL